jgi:hypothetical protein
LRTLITPLHREAAAMVYITSDLFGPNTSHGWQQDNTNNYWPGMMSEQHVAALGKRKRQADDEEPPVYDGIPALHA